MTDPTTPEAMLAAVIEAQVNGGQPLHRFLLTEFDGLDGPFILIKGHDIETCHILEVLLDPEGLKAAYGEHLPCSICSLYERHPERKDEGHGCISGTWRDVARTILDAWLSGGADAAIRTAYELLPGSRDSTLS
jgi:hypothetical protein